MVGKRGECYPGGLGAGMELTSEPTDITQHPTLPTISTTAQSMWLKFLVRIWLFNLQPHCLLCFHSLNQRALWLFPGISTKAPFVSFFFAPSF